MGTTVLIRALTIGLLVAMSSCTAPALMPAHSVDAQLAIELYPQGTEPVVVGRPDGVVLRGLFVPSDAGAPVVLHLLESSGSVASLKYHYAPLCWQLAELGYASLLIDYSGMGASEGKPSARNLEPDVRRMWEEAVARARGDPGRVVLRGVSLGTIAAALLLEAGVEPGAVVLVAPVLPDTAAARFGSRTRGRFIGWLAGCLYRDLAPVDVNAVVAACSSPLLVVLGRLDFFLSDGDREDLERAVREASGSWSLREEGHVQTAIEAHALLPEEIPFYAGLFPGSPDVEQRLTALLGRLPAGVAERFEVEPARGRLSRMARFVRSGAAQTAAAIALANEPGVDAARFQWMLDERALEAELPFDELVQAVSIEGLPIEAFAYVTTPVDLYDRYGDGITFRLSTEAVPTGVRRVLKEDGALMQAGVDLGWDRADYVVEASELRELLMPAEIDEEELLSACVRLLLTAYRTPVRTSERAGRSGLEVYEDGRWSVLDLEGEPDSFGATGSFPRKLGRRATELLEARRP